MVESLTLLNIHPILNSRRKLVVGEESAEGRDSLPHALPRLHKSNKLDWQASKILQTWRAEAWCFKLLWPVSQFSYETSVRGEVHPQRPSKSLDFQLEIFEWYKILVVLGLVTKSCCQVEVSALKPRTHLASVERQECFSQVPWGNVLFLDHFEFSAWELNCF